ncbi:hypothetical protein MHBO_002093 [Bonamia ostreae]|uniref:phosphatidylserine decarboxylase n=1 Tax=Bonamia ostreae TaxID=126728 RepID=A0ABV2AL94_9EUKA
MNKLFQPKVLKGSLVVAASLSFYYFKKRKEPRQGNFRVIFYKSLPLRFLSRIAGILSTQTVPNFLRKPIFYSYSAIYGINLSEVQPLNSFRSFGDFFSRTLDIEKYRKIADSDIVSPVDGRVSSFGKLKEGEMIDAKGIKFSLKKFTGRSQEQAKNLHFVAFYLSPGDYHRFHSPVKWSIKRLKHFSGNLLPVNSSMTNLIPSMLCSNERVVLEGTWKHGYCSVTPIGALNVGSIVLSKTIDPKLSTNLPQRNAQKEILFEEENSNGIKMPKIVELGFFKIGSSVVVLYDIPEDKNFLFRIREGQKIKVGNEIGYVV